MKAFIGVSSIVNVIFVYSGFHSGQTQPLLPQIKHVKEQVQIVRRASTLVKVRSPLVLGEMRSR